MAILARAEGFTDDFEAKNFSARRLSVGVAGVVRAAVTVGGPVKGTAWQRSQRRTAIVGTVLSALTGRSRRQSLQASTLYTSLEATEKGGVSFRLGMAFAALMGERILEIDLLEHLNSSNSLLCPTGSNRRADLFGFDRAGRCHVIEAKARANGHRRDLVDEAKEQARNVMVVDARTGPYAPRTRSAAVTDLSSKPVSVLLEDPPEGEGERPYEIETEEVLAAHYSVVPDLLELHGSEQPPPEAIAGDVIGAFLPGTDLWLGVDRSLYGWSGLSWRERVRRHEARLGVAEKGVRQSVGRDGHVLQVGETLADLYEIWQGEDEATEEIDENRPE